MKRSPRPRPHRIEVSIPLQADLYECSQIEGLSFMGMRCFVLQPTLLPNQGDEPAPTETLDPWSVIGHCHAYERLLVTISHRNNQPTALPQLVDQCRREF